MTAGNIICEHCGSQYCSGCVVFPFGASGPAICIACALELGGVQRKRGAPKMSSRAIKKRIAAHQSEQTAIAAQTALVSAQISTQLSPPDFFLWLDDANEASEQPGGWKQSYQP